MAARDGSQRSTDRSPAPAGPAAAARSVAPAHAAAEHVGQLARAIDTAAELATARDAAAAAGDAGGAQDLHARLLREHRALAWARDRAFEHAADLEAAERTRLDALAIRVDAALRDPGPAPAAARATLSVEAALHAVLPDAPPADRHRGFQQIEAALAPIFASMSTADTGAFQQRVRAADGGDELVRRWNLLGADRQEHLLGILRDPRRRAWIRDLESRGPAASPAAPSAAPLVDDARAPEPTPAPLAVEPGAATTATATATATAAPARSPRGGTTRAAQEIGAVVKSLADLDDAALRARKAELTARLAGDLDPDEREALGRERDAIEWLEYLHRLERGEPGDARTDGQDRVAALQAAPAAGVDPARVGARDSREQAYRRAGTWGQLVFDNEHPAEAREDGAQHAAIHAEVGAFLEDFRAQARLTAIGMLDASSAELDRALAQYGFVGGRHRLKFAAEAYNRAPDDLDRHVEEWRALSDTGDRKAETRRGDAAQVDLAATVARLRSRTAQLRALEDTLRPGRGDAVESADQVQTWETVLALRTQLAEDWLDAEAAHPALLAFRDPKHGADADRLGALDQAGPGMEQAILRQAIPKLGNILRIKTAVTSGALDPMRLAPAVELAKQQLKVPPGSLRDRAVADVHAAAGMGDSTDEILSAFSIALSLLAFVPTLGPGAKAAAEAVSLAIELRAQVNEHTAWQTAGGMDNTALDMARSVSTSAPELRPFVLRLAVAGASAASIGQLAHLALKLQRVRAAGGAVDDVVRELDDLGAPVGLRNLGDEVAGGVRGAGVYTPRTRGDRIPSRLNAEKVRDGLKRANARAYARGARLEAAIAQATADGTTATLRVPTDAGTASVRIDLRFTGDLPAAAHGADAGPARFQLDHDGTSWTARIHVGHDLDPRDVEFVVGHEVDEIAELVRRHPQGKPPEGFDAEMSAGVMRDGAKTNQSTAHDVATAHEIVALKHQLARVPAGSDNAAHYDATLQRLLKSAGLDEVAEIDAKLHLLTHAGAPADLLDQVRMVATRQLAAKHRAAMGAKGTRFTEEMIDHVMWGRGRSASEFARGGVEGGHVTERLLQMGYPNGDYVFVEVAQKAAGSTTARRFDQYRWRGPAAVPSPGSGDFPTDKPFNPAGWIKTPMPKTTFDDAGAFLREAEDAFARWVDAGATPGSNGTWSAVSANGIPIAGYLQAGAATPTPTTAFVEAMWF